VAAVVFPLERGDRLPQSENVEGGQECQVEAGPELTVVASVTPGKLAAPGTFAETFTTAQE
jgi:hypothetical protein